MAHFLTHIQYPTITRIYIDSMSASTADESILSRVCAGINFDRVYAPSARTVALVSRNGLRQSALFTSSVNAVSLSFHPWLILDDHSHNDTDIDLSMILARESIFKLVPGIADATALTIVCSVDLGDAECLRHFTVLRHLTLSGTKLAEAIPLLEVQIDASSGPLLLPSLQSISIGGCGVWDLISTARDSSDPGALCLRRTLQSRADSGHPINTVLVHIKEELEFIDREDWDNTSCSKYLHNVGKIVRDRLGDLYAIEGLSIVPYDSVYLLNEGGRTGKLTEWFV